ncbi:MAG: oligosaccharide flippase family protein, partial [Lachnospiraceae bacterium]|nr:oligosaccharide flippase family protein [Lachnospiraceae bacterium]
MKKEKLSSNLIMQFLYQGVTLVIPLIISPFLTRTLGSNALGVYTYTYSIAYYFVMFAMLGISRHGQRIISQNRDDDEKLRKVFWSLFFTHIVVSLVSFAVYLGVSFVIGGDDLVIYLIQALYVLSALFNITWLFYGLENFKTVVIRNTVVKAVECLLIFLLIRQPSDLWKYTLISAGGILTGQAVMLPQAVATVKPVRFGWEDVKQHIKPLLVFSISVIAVSLYTVFDKTLLGLMTTKENVAFYEYSNKIITILVSLIGAVGTVMYPRACAMAAKKDYENQKKFINYSF